MRHFVCFLCITIIFQFISTKMLYAQWVKTNGPSGAAAFASSGSKLFAGTEGYGVYISSDNGANWNAANSGIENASVYALTVKDNNIFAGISGGGVFISTNDGASWTAANNGLGENAAVWALAVIDKNLFAGTNTGVFLSTDNGKNWKITNTDVINNSISNFAVYGTNLFAGTLGGMFNSTDNGKVWTDISTGLTNKYIKALTFSGSNLFAGTSSAGVFLSTNYGTDWTEVNNGLTNKYIEDIAVSGTNIFAGTWNGVYYSNNNGESWDTVNSGLTNKYFRALFVHNNYLFAGLNADKIWRRPLSDMVPTAVEKIDNNMPAKFLLKQNYPNPFNPGTTISWELPSNGHVTLMIYDGLGRAVKTLVNEYKTAGKYSISFDASGFASGIYFYQLKSGSFTSIKKMILMK